MKGFLINPYEKAITEVDYSGRYQEIYRICDYQTFDVATFNNKMDSVFVDDEGLFKEDRAFFVITGYPQPLAGKGLVLGCNKEGESTAPTVDMEWLENNVRFL